MSDRPALFSVEPLDAAIARGKAEGRLVLIDFTAGWCQPCQHMDRTTWRAPEVEAWVKANAVAVQVDTEADEALGEEWSVRALPTVVVLRDGVEIDRVSGARPAAALLHWLEGLREGRTELDALAATEKTDLQGRFQYAQKLLDVGRVDDAMNELVWLWDHALEVEPGWVGVRLSYLLSVLEEVIDRSEAALKRVEVLCDAAAAKRETAFADWMALCGLLEREDEVLEWLRAASPDEVARCGADRDHRLVELVEERHEWAALGRVLREPVQHLRNEHERVGHILEDVSTDELPRELVEQTSKLLIAGVRRRAGALVKALRAAARNADADAVAAEAVKLDPSDEMKLQVS